MKQPRGKRIILLILAVGMLLTGVFLISMGLFVTALAGPSQAVWPDIDISKVAEGLQYPLYVTHAGDGSQRLFIVEQPGRIVVLNNGSVSPTPFLDIRERVLFEGEQGLLGLAFPPDYSQTGLFYVYYTNKDGNNQVSRFHTGSTPDQADPSAEEVILLLNHPDNNNHNGGHIAFGPDGYLYIATGDGGGSGDTAGNAQDTSTLLGKILRIQVEIKGVPVFPAENTLHLPLILKSGKSSQRLLYAIPATNPFVGVSGTRPEIWAYGLRNPWRFSFDRLTGDLYIGDVGQGSSEEVDFQSAGSPGGENYGWNIMEGMECFNAESCDQEGLVLPVYVYSTHVNETCAITGGYVYRGASFPAMQGIYFFGDFCQGSITGLRIESGDWVSHPFLDTEMQITSFGEDEAGELYVVDQKGAVYRIVEKVGREFRNLLVLNEP